MLINQPSLPLQLLGLSAVILIRAVVAFKSAGKVPLIS
jgi:hypothetical protein